jgi:type IV pilus assembly protein PilO
MKLGKYDIRRDNIGNWPRQFRVGVIIGIIVLLLLLAYWFDFSHLSAKKTKLIREEQTLKISLAQKQQIAVNLPAYQQQVDVAENELRLLSNQLPSEAEVPSLIEEISKLGQANGLIFTLLQPSDEVQNDYYAELPIHIIVQGKFAQIYQFINAIANMNRIVSIANFRLISQSSAALNNSPTLTFDFTAITYRYTPEGKATTATKPQVKHG